jgi:hypothetical protein
MSHRTDIPTQTRAQQVSIPATFLGEDAATIVHTFDVAPARRFNVGRLTSFAYT